MLTDTERAARKTGAYLGHCITCHTPLYDSPLGPEHLRFSQDRDHTGVPAPVDQQALDRALAQVRYDTAYRDYR